MTIRLLTGVGAEDPAWQAACSRIPRKVRLVAADGREPPAFLLHIDGAQAWWRWHDEPFEDTSSGQT